MSNRQRRVERRALERAGERAGERALEARRLDVYPPDQPGGHVRGERCRCGPTLEQWTYEGEAVRRVVHRELAAGQLHAVAPGSRGERS